MTEKILEQILADINDRLDRLEYKVFMRRLGPVEARDELDDVLEQLHKVKIDK